MANAGIYVRISQDRAGAGLGVARQEEDCRALCDRLGWSISEVYVDNDTSAYSGKPRPAWERLLRDVRNGVIDAIAVWHVDRLTRSPRELEDVVDLADKYGLSLATVTGEIDLATPTGRMVARIMGAAARHESEQKAARHARQRRQAAEAGKVAGGGTRPFGYEDDRITVIDDEAQVIRECAARFLSGESLSSICRDLADRDVRTPAGGHWQPRTLRRMLASARISGRREHTPRSSWNGTRPLLGEIVSDNAAWPAIVSPDVSDRLRAKLSRPDAKYSSVTGRTYLLSGILRCGVCKRGLVGRPRSGVPRYVCGNVPGGPGCGKIAVNAARADDYVRDLVLLALESPEMAERLRTGGVPEDLDKRIREDEEQLEELAADWAHHRITRAEWHTARQVIEARLTRTRDQRARQNNASVLDLIVGGPYSDMLDRWKKLNVAQRRTVVAAVVESINVNPANPRKRWDPERFEPPVWRA